MIGKYPRKAKFTRKTDDLLQDDYLYISPSYTRDYQFVVASGQGREVTDIEGNVYLDFGAGIAVTSTGHCHPEIVKTIKNQADNLIHMSGTDFYYEVQIELAKALNKIVPINDYTNTMSFFCNSGAEANEAAMKLARYATGSPGYIAFTGAFHGRTMGALSLTGSKAIQKEGFLPLQPVAHAPYADCRNCFFGSHKDKCNSSDDYPCLNYLESQILERTFPGSEVAACFVEAIQGEGGYIVPPVYWLRRLSEICKDFGILLVVDEVQSGIGRTGRWFASEHFDVLPDIITVAKGVASGMPLGVMIADHDIMEEWEPGSHASTFGGNPISCAAALKTLEIIEKEDLLTNATDVGGYLGKMLGLLAKSYDIVNNPRGLGLMRAIDIVDPQRREDVLDKCFDSGLILLGCGASGIRFCPALNVTKEEVDVCITLLEEAVKYVSTH